MDRGVLVGGTLIAVSLAGAIVLNRSANHDPPQLPYSSPPPPCQAIVPPDRSSIQAGADSQCNALPSEMSAAAPAQGMAGGAK